MSLRSALSVVIPDETAQVARAANPRGTTVMWVRDRLDGLFTDEDFAAWFPPDGRPALSPARLALHSVLQHVLGLSDRAAAEAVRCRIDVKYALALELDDPGFHHSVLGDFRDRLLVGDGDRFEELFDLALGRLKEAGLVNERGKARTDSTHVLSSVRDLSRLELVVETARAAVEGLAAHDPGWLAHLVEPGWGRRYGRPAHRGRMPSTPESQTKLAVQVGADGTGILHAVTAPDAPAALRDLPQVQVLRRVWLQQFVTDGATRAIRWRTSGAAGDARPPMLGIVSPYDTEVRYTKRASDGWKGWQVHITETCDDNRPRVITDVATVDAPVHDSRTLPAIHDRLAARSLRPAVHLVDGGYMSVAAADRAGREHQIQLAGPIRKDTSVQRRKGTGFDKSAFSIDFDNRVVTCPNGWNSAQWVEPYQTVNGVPYVLAKFGKRHCTPCPLRSQCTKSETAPRNISFLPRNLYDLQARMREEQQTPAWRHQYAMRSGVESTMCEIAVGHRLRRGRYRGQRKTHLQHVLTAVGINLERLCAWEQPPPRSRRPPTTLHQLLTFTGIAHETSWRHSISPS